MDEDYKELVGYLDEKFQKVATKDDLNNLSVKLLPREEFEKFEKEISRELFDIKESINTLTNSIDKLVGSVNSLTQEYTMVANKIDRHEKWLHQVAEKLGIKLEY